jgi:hypothetical protein
MIQKIGLTANTKAMERDEFVITMTLAVIGGLYMSISVWQKHEKTYKKVLYSFVALVLPILFFPAGAIIGALLLTMLLIGAAGSAYDEISGDNED